MIFYCLSYHKLITLQSSNGQREVNYRQFNPFAQPSQEGWRAQTVIMKVEIEENTVATVISLHPYSFTHSTSYSPYLPSRNAVSWTMGEMLAGAWDSPSGYKGRNWERAFFFFKTLPGYSLISSPLQCPFCESEPIQWVRAVSRLSKNFPTEEEMETISRFTISECLELTSRSKGCMMENYHITAKFRCTFRPWNGIST